MRQLLKGNEAVVRGAIAAGCKAYFGYPITPASEIAEVASLLLPDSGGIFVPAESEIGAIQMVFGASSAGVRAMTASSGPGISLMQEGVSYMAGAELPGVIVDIMRAGPGLGNLGVEQGDYLQLTKGGGHGNYRTPVFAPNSVQEMCDLTIHAFEVADRYRNPVYVLADGALGQMMEPIEIPAAVQNEPEKPWAVRGDAATRKNLITSIFLEHEKQEILITKLEEKYREIEEKEVLWQEIHDGRRRTPDCRLRHQQPHRARRGRDCARRRRSRRAAAPDQPVSLSDETPAPAGRQSLFRCWSWNSAAAS